MDRSITEDLEFICSDLDERYLRGFIKFFTYSAPYVDPTYAANIYYSETLNTCWKRFVHCKEMFHLLDEPEQRASTRIQITDLVQAITSVTQMGDPEPQEKSERNAMVAAIELLFPWEHRKALSGAYASGTYSALDLAEMFKVPERFVATAMSERYSTIITDWRQHLAIEPLFT